MAVIRPGSELEVGGQQQGASSQLPEQFQPRFHSSPKSTF